LDTSVESFGQAPIDGPELVECKSHGEQTSAIVCRHVLGPMGERRGWIENKSDPNDTQGWCLECEAQFKSEGGMSEAFRAFNDFAVVCRECYRGIVAYHTLSGGADV
jgi:hypothetical protein